jgi:hypothetical protein
VRLLPQLGRRKLCSLRRIGGSPIVIHFLEAFSHFEKPLQTGYSKLRLEVLNALVDQPNEAITHFDLVPRLTIQK